MTTTIAEIFLLAIVSLALLAFTLVTPILMPLTRPYGVSVPLNLVAHPVLATARKTYTATALALGGGGAVLSLAIASLAPGSTVALIILAPFLFLAVTALASSRAAKLIRTSKEAENWYADRATGLTVDVREQAGEKPRSSKGWFYASAGLIILAAFILALRYPHLPDPYPVHYNALGEADGWDKKTIFNVFFPVGMMGFTLVSMMLAQFGVGLQADAQDGEKKLRELGTKKRDSMDKLGEALGITAADYMNLRQRLTLQKSLELIGPMTFNLTVGVGYLTLVDPLGAPPWMRRISLPLFSLLVFGFVLLLHLAVSRVTRNLDSSVLALAERGGIDITQIELPETDRYYKAGILYANREDHRIFIPRIIGSGFSLNWGNPLAYLVLLAILAPGIIALAVAVLSRP